jgi:predicted phage terminase large subunit-like protein
MAVLEGGMYVVEDVKRDQIGPGGVLALITQTAAIDPPGTIVGFAQDPAAAGKFEAWFYVRQLAGMDCRVITETSDKVTRSRPLSTQVAATNVSIVSGAWNDEYLDELHAFPDGPNDDQVDASAGAFTVLAGEMEFLENQRGGVRVRVVGR